MQKKIISLFISLFSSFTLLHAELSWQGLFQERQADLSESYYAILKQQYATFLANTALTIADPIIRDIPLIENNERLIDVNEMKHPRIAMLPNHPTNQIFAGPDYNSGLQSASKMRASVWNKLEMLVIGLDALAEQFGYQAGTVDVRVFEGLRDVKTQQMLFYNKVEEIRKDNPSLGEEEIEAEASKWISPVKNNIPVHSTGAAIDIRLYNRQTNDFVDLGPFGVIWGNNPAVPTFSEHTTDSQKKNRLYLLMAAAQAGLINYVYEYWHFSSGDRYAVYWQEPVDGKRAAQYGTVNLDDSSIENSSNE